MGTKVQMGLCTLWIFPDSLLISSHSRYLIKDGLTKVSNTSSYLSNHIDAINTDYWIIINNSITFGEHMRVERLKILQIIEILILVL